MAKPVAAGYDGDLDPPDVELLRQWRRGEITYDEMVAQSANPEALKRVAGEVEATSVGASRGFIPPAGKLSKSTDVARLVDAVLKYEACDLHLAPGRPPSVRIRGDLHNLGQTPLTPEDTKQLMQAISAERHQELLEEKGDVRFSVGFGDKVRFRVCACKANGTITLTLRCHRCEPLSLQSIGLPPVVKDLCMRSRGLVLVTGPNGAGKSTTLAALIDFINTERADHILTIEDPVEFVHPHKKCQVTQRELHGDVSSFVQGLRCASDLAADVVLLGALPDVATMEAALVTAESGSLILSSLSTTGAATTIERFVASFPSERQGRARQRLADTLAAVISQTLLPTTDGRGRVVAFELMFSNQAIRELIRVGETVRIDAKIREGANEGMVLLDDSLFSLWTAQRITYNDMMRRCRDQAALEERVRRYTEDMRGGASGGVRKR